MAVRRAQHGSSWEPWSGKPIFVSTQSEHGSGLESARADNSPLSPTITRKVNLGLSQCFSLVNAASQLRWLSGASFNAKRYDRKLMNDNRPDT